VYDAVERDAPPLFAQLPQAPGRGGFGKYRFIGELGRGTTSVVNLAVVEPALGDAAPMVAVKELRTELREDAAMVAAFLEEGRLAARLDHPNLVRTFEVGRYGFRCFQAMEFIEGAPLSEVIKRARREGAPMPLAVLVRVLTEVLEALEHAHSLCDANGQPLGLVHRDVGLHSVMVTGEGVVKLLGFGGARPPAGRVPASEGKREDAYPAPECLYGLPVDRRADVFAVGVMLWQGILTRRAPETTWHTLSGPESVRADIDPKLFAIVERAMSSDPLARYPTARVMREELESYARASRLALPDLEAIAEFVSPLLETTRAQRAIAEAELLRFLPDSLAPTEASTPSTGPVTLPERGAAAVAGPAGLNPPAPTSSPLRRFALAAALGAIAGVGWVLAPSEKPAAPIGAAAPGELPARATAVAADPAGAIAPPGTAAGDPRQDIRTETLTAPPSEPRQVPDALTTPPPAPRPRAAGGKALAASGAAATTPADDAPDFDTLAAPAKAAASAKAATLPAAPSPQAPEAHDTPAVPKRSPGLSAIETPAAKPARDIIKQDPYLQ
jgi:serine/threonine-protein kinase